MEVYLTSASTVAGILAVAIGIAQLRRTPKPRPLNPRDLVQGQFERWYWSRIDRQHGGRGANRFPPA